MYALVCGHAGAYRKAVTYFVFFSAELEFVSGGAMLVDVAAWGLEPCSMHLVSWSFPWDGSHRAAEHGTFCSLLCGLSVKSGYLPPGVAGLTWTCAASNGACLCSVVCLMGICFVVRLVVVQQVYLWSLSSGYVSLGNGRFGGHGRLHGAIRVRSMCS